MSHDIFKSAEWAKRGKDGKSEPVFDRELLFMTTTKLHTLFEIAIEDFKQVLTDKANYHINMGKWHVQSFNHEKCSVCMAGAVLAKTLHWDKGKRFDPYYQQEGNYFELKKRMYAINALRSGSVAEAYMYLHAKEYSEMREKPQTGFDDLIVTEYKHEGDAEQCLMEWDRVLYYLKTQDI